ncbi:hypothetical protein [Shewanella chilikensis]|uniref:hypothetical protein n=1 Tax=Shewanella chilikensis TaxID=558541 RepID=UPI003A96F021
MKPEEMKPHYHRPESCNKCGAGDSNNITSGSFYDGELTTSCMACGHEDYWEYGFFESGERIESKCKRYVNIGGKLINL